MKEKRNVPRIRFKGFTDDWEQRKLGEISSNIIAGGDIDKTLISERKGYPVIANALSEDGIVGYYENQFRVKAPALTITGRGDVGHAKARFLNFTPVVRLLAIQSQHDVMFLENAINIKKVHVESTGVPQLTVPQIEQLEVSLPKSIREERRLGRCLNKLDKLITLHQRKLTTLKNVKKSMLEKLFPKNGESIPAIRFKGFTNAWEQRKVKDIFKITRGYVLASTLISDKCSQEYKYPVYSSQTKDSGLMGYYSSYLYENAITWTTDGANAGTVNYREGKFYCTNVCGVLLSDKISASKMLAEVLNRIAKKYVSYVGNPKLMNNTVAEISVIIPNNNKEQKYLSNVFSNLDNLITLHQRKLEKLKHIKKSMLEVMFI